MPSWVRLITRHQAQPGRRIRSGAQASREWTVRCTQKVDGRVHVLFTDGTSLEIRRLIRQRWEVHP